MSKTFGQDWIKFDWLNIIEIEIFCLKLKMVSKNAFHKYSQLLIALECSGEIENGSSYCELKTNNQK